MSLFIVVGMTKLTTLTLLLICLCSVLASVLVWLSLAYQKLKEEQASLDLQCEEAVRRERYAEAKLKESNELRQVLKAKWQDATQENNRLQAKLESESRGREANMQRERFDVRLQEVHPQIGPRLTPHGSPGPIAES